MKNKARLIDMAKNFAIVLLLISAGFLLLKATVGGRGSFFGGLEGLFDGNSDSVSAELPEGEVTTLASDPVFLLVTSETGSHYAVKYNNDTKDKLMAQFSGSLGEALGSSGKPTEVSVEKWQTALSGSGVFFDYLYPQPLSAIASSLGTEISSDASLETARRFYLGEDGGNLVLYFISEDEGIIYRCDTVLSFSTLKTKISECPLGSANFAFELGEDYANIDPYFIFSHENEPLSAVTVTNPVRDNYDGSGLLAHFGMNSRIVSELPKSDGSKVYVEGDKSLSIESSGRVIFDASGGNGIIIKGGSAGLTITDSISVCSEIVKNSIGLVGGDGVTELVKVSNVSTPSSCTVSFGYFVNGIPVTLPGGESAASFQIISGTIVKAELYLRRYTLPGGTIVPLPEKQAAVIAETRGGEPVLTYEDRTDSVTCAWIKG
ncbi:MAG: hypothetical protein CVU91_13155 [Firmicutes bacterium HGW-Firmicutes-16]|nr:MAG: hypothetical protein CVU91_13155 [Firmicutes bacterium HGW-Firmicutes-16]